MSKAIDRALWEPNSRVVKAGGMDMPHTVKPTPADEERARLNLAAEALDRNAADALLDVLGALGLSTRDGQVLIRFREEGSQIRLYVDPSGELRCMWCPLEPVDFVTRHAGVMTEHLHRHRISGHVVPWWAEQRVGAWRG